MAFTNKDAILFNKWFKKYAKWGWDGAGDFPIEKVQALLARLEAAEKVAEFHSGHDEDCDECSSSGPCSCDYDENDKAWRKSKGEP